MPFFDRKTGHSDACFPFVELPAAGHRRDIFDATVDPVQMVTRFRSGWFEIRR